MNDLWKGIRLLAFMTVLTGIAYPLGIAAFGRVVFRERAQGSLIHEGAGIVGSVWIGQGFFDPAYFRPRPSATSYGAVPSGASNQSVTHRDFKRLVEERRERLNVAEPPADLLYASGSGLDPHVSPEAALIQIGRISEARNAIREDLRNLVESAIEPPTFGVLGEPRVNVLLLNRELDREFPRSVK